MSLKLFNNILDQKLIPEQFKKVEIVVIYQKDDRSDFKNYRPVSLLSHLYKILMIALTERMKTDILKDIPNSQAAYQEGRSTNEQILALKQIIEKKFGVQQTHLYCFY